MKIFHYLINKQQVENDLWSVRELLIKKMQLYYGIIPKGGGFRGNPKVLGHFFCVKDFWKNSIIKLHFFMRSSLRFSAHSYSETLFEVEFKSVHIHIWAPNPVADSPLFLKGQDSLATSIKYQRYGQVCKGNTTFESCVEGKSSGREILCTLGVTH